MVKEAPRKIIQAPAAAAQPLSATAKNLIAILDGKLKKKRKRTDIRPPPRKDAPLPPVSTRPDIASKGSIMAVHSISSLPGAIKANVEARSKDTVGCELSSKRRRIDSQVAGEPADVTTAKLHTDRSRIESSFKKIYLTHSQHQTTKHAISCSEQPQHHAYDKDTPMALGLKLINSKRPNFKSQSSNPRLANRFIKKPTRSSSIRMMNETQAYGPSINNLPALSLHIQTLMTCLDPRRVTIDPPNSICKAAIGTHSTFESGTEQQTPSMHFLPSPGKLQTASQYLSSAPEDTLAKGIHAVRQAIPRPAKPDTTMTKPQENFVRLNMRNSAGACRGARNKKALSKAKLRQKLERTETFQSRESNKTFAVRDGALSNSGIDPVDDFLDGTYKTTTTTVKKKINNTTAAIPKCPGHQAPCKLLSVKRNTENKGRPFYCCSFSRGEQCEYFQWADDTIAVRYRKLCECDKDLHLSGFLSLDRSVAVVNLTYVFCSLMCLGCQDNLAEELIALGVYCSSSCILS
jgi:hypothetical protein